MTGNALKARGCAKYVGRVGALAVALGVGVAVATGQGAGLARADGDSSDSSDSSSSASAGTSSSESPSTPEPAGGTSAESAPTSTENSASGTGSTPSGGSGGSGPTPPSMKVSSSGGTDTSTNDAGQATDTRSATEAATTPEVGVPVEAPTEVTDAEPVPAAPDRDANDAPTPVAHASDTPPPPVDEPDRTPAASATQPFDTAPTNSSPVALRTTSITVDRTPDALATSTPIALATTLAVTNPPVPQQNLVSNLIALPGAIVKVATTVVAALLTPFLAPGPAAPAEPPLLWAVLSFVRREIQRTFFNRSPVAVGDSLTTSEGTSGTVAVLANDTDRDGDALTVESFTQGAHGAVTRNADGTLSYTPDAGYVGTDSFTYTVGDDAAEWHVHGLLGFLMGGGHTSTATVNVTVTGVANTPVVTAENASGDEDSAIPLTIGVTFPDTSGAEVHTITIGGVLAGATLNTGVVSANGTWTLAPADLDGLTVTPPPNSDATMTLTVTATATENGTTASASATLTVTVNGVADTPTVTTQAAAGTTNTPIPLSISVSTPDTDGSETVTIVITGVPAGATLNHGTRTAAGWNLTPADLAGLTITPPLDAGTLTLTVTATTTEGLTEATATATLTVSTVRELPIVTVSNASGDEDTAIPLNVSATINDPVGAYTIANITISGVPAGASLNHGTDNGNGTWTLNPTQLTGLTLTPPPNYSGTFRLAVAATSNFGDTANASLLVTVSGVADTPTVVINGLGPGQTLTSREDQTIPLNITVTFPDDDGSETHRIVFDDAHAGVTLNHGTRFGAGQWSLTEADLVGLTVTPPPNFSGIIRVTVAATSAEDDTSAVATDAILWNVTGVADAPSVSVTNATGLVGTAIPLSVSVTFPDDDGSEQHTIEIAGVPSTATLNHGVNVGGGTWRMSQADLSGLTITASMAGTLGLSVNASASEGQSGVGVGAPFTVTVLAPAQAPSVSTMPSFGFEDTPVSLRIAVTSNDPAVVGALTVTVSGVPAGATLNKGTALGGGAWALTPADLSGLTLTPPRDFSGPFTIMVGATSTVLQTAASTSASPLAIQLQGVADPPSLTVLPASGTAGTAIPLSIAAASTDRDGGERVYVEITDVPVGATFSSGTQNSPTKWTFMQAQLPGLTFTPPASTPGAVVLTVSAVATEGLTGAIAGTQLTVTVTADTLGVDDDPGNVRM